MRKRVAALVLLVVLAACGTDGPTEPAMSVAGAWTGSLSAGGSVFQFTATLTEAAGSITGNGTVQGGGKNSAATNSGTRSGVNVSLAWATPGIAPVNYTATLSGGSEKMSGILNGSGFNGESLIMNKN